MAAPDIPHPEDAPSSIEPPPTVPEELLNKLHEANQRFSQARHHREEAIDAPTPETTERDQAKQEMRDAETQVEEVTEEIERDLHGSH